MLLMFDEGSLRAGGIKSKVKYPAPIFSFTGTSQALVTAPTGGMALSTSGNSTDDILASATVLSATTTWSLSALVKFDGTAGGSGNGALAGNANAPIEFIATNAVNLLIADSAAGTPATGITMASLNGWTRLTITETNASPSVIRTYKNGVLADTTNSGGNNATMSLQSFVNGWGFPTADIFVWNRTLSADHVAAHAADPYGTVMRSRFAGLGIKGTVATGKKPSLLTLGVGP